LQNIYAPTKDFEILEDVTIGSMPFLHTHNTYEIYYLNEGKRTYIIDNKVYEVKAGDFALIPPNVFHKTTGDAYNKRTLICFSLDFLEKAFTSDTVNEMLSCFSTHIISLPDSEREGFLQLCRQINTQEKAFSFKGQLFLANVLSLLKKYATPEKTTPKNSANRLLSEILNYICENFQTIENLEEISDNFLITKFHLCRIFKENTGMSVFSYINTLKIQSACNLLLNTNKSITEISEECGFSSHIYFCKAFKKQHGITPTKYRKNKNIL